MFKSRITFVLFLLVWMGIMSMLAYNLGHSSAKWAADDRERMLREKHTSDLETAWKRVREKHDEVESLRKEHEELEDYRREKAQQDEMRKKLIPVPPRDKK